MAWLEVVLAGEPLLAATGDTDESLLERGLDVEAEGLCLGDLLGSSTFFSTHSSGEGDLFDFLAFLVALGLFGDSETLRLDFLLGGGDLLALRLLCFSLFGEGERLALCFEACCLDCSWSEGESYGSEDDVDSLRAALGRRKCWGVSGPTLESTYSTSIASASDWAEPEYSDGLLGVTFSALAWPRAWTRLPSCSATKSLALSRSVLFGRSDLGWVLGPATGLV